MTDPHGRTAQGSRPCTTHHHACDCREAVHKEVADALAGALVWLERLMRDRLYYTVEETNSVLSHQRAALEKYREMYP